MTDVADAYGLGGRPYWMVIGALFVIVMARSHGTYWVGRAVQRSGRAVARRALAGDDARPPRRWHRGTDRLRTWSTTPAAQRSRSLLDRWGPVAVTFSYLTVGAQTAILATAGLISMPYRRFTIASLPGAMAWAVIWGTVGLSAVWAAAALAARSPWVLAAAIGAVVVVVVATVVVRRRLAATRTSQRR